MTSHAHATTTATRPPAATATMPVPADAPYFARFPDFPPRDDMMNNRYLHDYGQQPALRLFLGRPETTLVLGEVPLAWDIPRGRAGVRIPDLMVAFEVNADQILNQMGYAIRQHGKAPDFVLEVASNTTSLRDETIKWRDYAAYGVSEYWLFDPDWGQRYAQGLIGWTLVNGSYEPIPISEYEEGLYYGYSAALGLYVCWEHGRLRWYDVETGYLRTHDEERDGRILERGGRIAAEALKDLAEEGRDAERNARLAAEAQRDEERNSRLAAESENQRLRDELARLRGDGNEA